MNEYIDNKNYDEEMDYFVKELKMFLESENAMDKSLFPKQPIDEQLKNMTPEDFFKLFNNDFSYQDDIVNTVDNQIKDIQENNNSFEEMINNNDPVFIEMELKKNVERKKKLFEDIRMEMEREDAMDPSLFPKQPIDEQLKNMTPEDFFKLFNDDFSYQDDILKSLDKQIKDIQENNITPLKLKILSNK